MAVARRLANYAAKTATPSTKLTLNDVKGVPLARAKLREMIVDLDDWTAGKIAWKDVSASALLYGPPGSGKNLDRN